jgi:flagellar hook-associated protein 1 FlgK
VNGDTYLIRPTRNGALNLEMNLADSRQIATASPVRSETALSNTGSGVISAGVVTDINNAAFQTVPGSLSPPLLISFTGGASYDIYDNTIPGAPVLLEAGIAFNPATGGDVFPTPGGFDYGYQMTLTGAPVAGDEFTIDFNTGGTGDNRNALLLAGLSTEKLMNGGTDSVSQVYSGLVGEVGTATAQAERNSITQQQLYDQSVATRENLVGVNLDEEAADLIRFQQAYQAAAQVISTAQSLFDTLLNAVR